MTNLKTRLTMSAFLLAVLCTAAVGKTIYVDEHATGANDGSNWADAYRYLQDGLADANPAEKPAEIWVAQGTYKPDQGANQILRDREATFQLINGVSIYGGFPSGGAEFEQRDPNLYETTLSGDLDGNDVSVSDPCDLLNKHGRAENSHHVVTGSWNNETALLDGFTISGGYADGSWVDGYYISGTGGGMYNTFSDPTLTNCTFSGNSADRGGGMHNEYFSHPILTNCTFSVNRPSGMENYDFCNPILTNCTFSGNSAGRGGGMRNHLDCNPTLTNCTFSGNSATYGGGMSNSVYSDPTLTNCTFSGNSADRGGGMDNDDESDPTLTGCTFSGNSAEDEGGGMNNYDSSPILTNCTFSGNSASHGGGMHNSPFSDPTLTNCTFSGNSADRGGGMDSYNRSTPTLTSCILWGNTFPQVSGDATISYSNIHGAFPGEGNIDIDPFFVDPGYWDANGTPNHPKDDFWVDGDYHLKSEAGRWDPNSKSWVLDDVNSPCIDAGDPNICIGFEPNPNGGVVNMGAYGGTAKASLSPSGIECISADHPDYYEWVEVGAPACWCHERQCHGDTDCKSQGKQKYWVSTDDLDILIAGWNKPVELLSASQICADFDHKAQGKKKYRVSVNDLDILIANWNKANVPADDCP
jgi:hypothetical protein